MNEFKTWIMQNKELVIFFATTVLSALSSSTVFLAIRNHFLNKRIQELAKEGYRVKCPVCKKDFPLREAHFIMSDGALDDNLNGIPDDVE